MISHPLVQIKKLGYRGLSNLPNVTCWEVERGRMYLFMWVWLHCFHRLFFQARSTQEPLLPEMDPQHLSGLSE